MVYIQIILLVQKLEEKKTLIMLHQLCYKLAYNQREVNLDKYADINRQLRHRSTDQNLFLEYLNSSLRTTSQSEKFKKNSDQWAARSFKP